MKLFEILQQKTVYLAVLAAFFLLRLVPMRLSRAVAPLFGWIGYFTPGFGDIALMNLRAAFPEKSEGEIREIARASFAHLFLTFMEFFWVKGRPEEFKRITFCDEECKRTAKMAKESGAPGMIFVTPHAGNWEYAGMTLALLLDFKVGIVVRTARNPYLDKFISSGRMVEGIRVIHSKGAVRGMVHAIEDGYAVGTLIDQNTRARDGGVFVDFFGLPAPVSRAPAAMARKNGYFVAVGSTRRLPDGSVVAQFKPSSKPVSEYASDEELTQDIMAMSEEFIRRAPEQYLWFYKRFQYIPPDASEELKKRYPAYAKVADERFFDKGAARRNPLRG